MSGALICDGDLTIASDGAPICSGTWQLVYSAYTGFDPSTLDLGVLVQAFGVGFICVAIPLCAVFGARAIFSTIRG
jgi:hypothetical protein